MYIDEYDIELDFTDSVESELGIGDIWEKLGETISKTVGAVAQAAPQAAQRAIAMSEIQDTGYSDSRDEQAYKREQLFTKIVERVNKHVMPLLKEMDQIVDYSDAQTKATNEHNELLKNDLFRKGVVVELKLLSRRLPNGHPVRTQIENL